MEIHNQEDNNIRNILSACHSYQKSFTIVNACRLKIFSYLYNVARNFEQLCELCQIKKKDAFALFLDACIEVGLLSKSGDLYRNTPSSNELLSEESPQYIGDIILLSVDYAKSWNNVYEFLKNGDSETKYPLIVSKLSEEQALRYVNGMHALSKFIGPEIVKFVELKNKKRLLDIGGGSGGYSMLFASQFNQLKVNVLELKPIAKYTKEIVKRSKVADQINVIEGDILKDDIPLGNDIIFISNIIHWYSKSDNMKILEKSYNAIKNGGTVILHDFMDENVKYMGFALFSFSRCLVTRQARAHSYDEVCTWLRQLKFKSINVVTLNNFAKTTLIVANK